MKLITFGCSFTDYAWPTWADIMALDLDCEYENWAIGGGGNQQIARRILYKDQQFGWQPDDCVMVQWSSITREDRWLNDNWVSQGSVGVTPFYGAKWVEKYWSWDNDVINTAQARMTTELLLKDRLKYQMAMTWGDVKDFDCLTDNPEMTDFWRSRLTLCDELPAHARPFGGAIADGHPDPRWWLNWVETKIYPQMGFTVKPSTRKKVQSIQHYLEQLVRRKTPQSELQHLASVYSNETWWPMRCKVKPGAQPPGQGPAPWILL